MNRTHDLDKQQFDGWALGFINWRTFVDGRMGEIKPSKFSSSDAGGRFPKVYM